MMFASPKTPARKKSLDAAADGAPPRLSARRCPTNLLKVTTAEPAPPPLPKSASKSVKSKALGMLKLGEKILPSDHAQQREPSMRSLSSLFGVGKTPAKDKDALREASMRQIPVGAAVAADTTPSKPANALQQQDTPAKFVKEVGQGAAAFELLIADMSKLRVQLRKTTDELDAEKTANKELKTKLDDAMAREQRRSELKAFGKTEQALAEEIKRMDGLLEEERAISANLQLRVIQLEDEVDNATGKNQVAKLEAVVADLTERLAAATAATQAVIGKSKNPESADIVFRAAKAEVEQVKAVLAQRTAQHQHDVEALRGQINELKLVVADKAKEVDDAQRRRAAAEDECTALTERVAAKTAEYESAMQQAIDEVARLDGEARATEELLGIKTKELAALKPLVDANMFKEAEKKRAEAQRMGEVQRDAAVAAAKKLFREKKISAKEYDNVIMAAEQALKATL